MAWYEIMWELPGIKFGPCPEPFFKSLVDAEKRVTELQSKEPGMKFYAQEAKGPFITY